MEKLKRYVILLLAMFVCSIGVVLVTKGDLGTTPISSLPYVLSMVLPLTMGAFTFIQGMLLVLFQFLLLRRDFKAEYLLQIPIYLAFGWFLDIWVPLFSFIVPQNYVQKLLVMVTGCMVIGVSVYLEVLADVVMLPAESFVRAVVKRRGTEFGATKICFDVTLCILAAAVSLICLGELKGVREGTLVAAVLVGYVARLFKKKLAFLPEKIYKA